MRRLAVVVLIVSTTIGASAATAEAAKKPKPLASCLAALDAVEQYGTKSPLYQVNAARCRKGIDKANDYMPTTTVPPTTIPPTTAPKPAATAPKNSPSMTLAEYDALQSGTTYEEAVDIIGGPGQEISRSDIAGYTTVMYQWSGSGSPSANANAMFQNGRLITKAQFGLR